MGGDPISPACMLIVENIHTFFRHRLHVYSKYRRYRARKIIDGVGRKIWIAGHFAYNSPNTIISASRRSYDCYSHQEHSKCCRSF